MNLATGPGAGIRHAFVADACVALEYAIDQAGESRAYAARVLELPSADIHVPGIFHLEVANVLSRYEARGVLLPAQTGSFLRALEARRLLVDGHTAALAFGAVLPLARMYRLTSYDASYLELAIRLGIPLATLDSGLRAAAAGAGVPLFDPA